jgi:hypothetical protein
VFVQSNLPTQKPNRPVCCGHAIGGAGIVLSVFRQLPQVVLPENQNKEKCDA